MPFIVSDLGDSHHEIVAAKRNRLLHRTTPLENISPFLVGGMLGVGVGIDTATGTLSRRKPAP